MEQYFLGSTICPLKNTFWEKGVHAELMNFFCIKYCAAIASPPHFFSRFLCTKCKAGTGVYGLVAPHHEPIMSTRLQHDCLHDSKGGSSWQHTE